MKQGYMDPDIQITWKPILQIRAFTVSAFSYKLLGLKHISVLFIGGLDNKHIRYVPGALICSTQLIMPIVPERSIVQDC